MKIRFFGRKFLIALALLLGVVAVWLAAWAFWYEPASLTVKQYAIQIPDSTLALSNLKIVAISDIHGGSSFVTAEKIRQVVESANAQNPDLIVLLGDFVSQEREDRKKLKMPMRTIAENLRGLTAKYGAFAVIGNHDVWYDEQVVQTELDQVGVRVLNGDAIRIRHNNQHFVLLGLPEFIKHGSSARYSKDAKAVLARFDDIADDPVIALVHNPDVFKWITGELLISDRLRLVLAGHTHGGQCDLPFVGTPVVPSSYGQKYAKGLIEENGRQMFVTPGIGTSIFSVRFRVPPEISVLTVSS